MSKQFIVSVYFPACSENILLAVFCAETREDAVQQACWLYNQSNRANAVVIDMGSFYLRETGDEDLPVSVTELKENVNLVSALNLD